MGFKRDGPGADGFQEAGDHFLCEGEDGAEFGRELGGEGFLLGFQIGNAGDDDIRGGSRRFQSFQEVAEFYVRVFDLLPELASKGKAPYDFIILDPPAFTKSRKTVDSARRGYKEINLRALRLLPRGGLLATASCSHFMPSEEFVKMLKAAALDAGVELRQIEARQQAPDHPILWNVPETDYLKFYLFQVV